MAVLQARSLYTMTGVESCLRGGGGGRSDVGVAETGADLKRGSQ